MCALCLHTSNRKEHKIRKSNSMTEKKSVEFVAFIYVVMWVWSLKYSYSRHIWRRTHAQREIPKGKRNNKGQLKHTILVYSGMHIPHTLYPIKGVNILLADVGARGTRARFHTRQAQLKYCLCLSSYTMRNESMRTW